MMPTASIPACPTSRAAPERPLRWELRRHCRLRPVQLLAGCALPCVIGLLIGLGFAVLGCAWPLAFALLQAAGMGVAFLVHARHVGDRAVLTLRDGWLEVAKHRGSRLSVSSLPLAWLRMQQDPAGLRFDWGASSVRVRGYATPSDCAAVLKALERARRDAAQLVSAPAQGRGPMHDSLHASLRGSLHDSAVRT